MRAFLIVILVGLLAVGGFKWLHQPPHPAPVNASPYETDMVENLVRRLLAELTPPTPPVCFLAFGDGTTSPSEAFLERFAGSRPVVRGCDSAAMPPIGKNFETSTGHSGLMLHIVNFKEIIPDSFDVEVTISNLPAGHDRFIYRICRLGGEWQIESRKPA